jgi:DNA (cytosine-5)-methyltransferase 1
LSHAGHVANLLCEIDRGASAVLAEKFSAVPLHDDVAKLEELPDSTTLITAGFPCQDLSQAGKTAGIAGKNSGLVDHVFRLLERKRVPWVLLENVSFMLRLARGQAMRHVLERLEELGYRWAYRVVDSRSFGVPQRRERVYLLACLPHAGDPRDVLLEEDTGTPEPPASFKGRANGFYWTEGIRGLGWAVDAIPTLKGGSTIGIPSPPAIWMPDDTIVKPDIRDGERLQGFPPDWTIAASRVTRPGARWKLIGNAVSVHAATWLGERLVSHGVYDPSYDVPLEAGSRWPDAAWSLDRGHRFTSGVSRWPRRVCATPLTEFLLYPTVPLSARATAGFLSRARTSSLRFPPGFLDAVEMHLQSVQQQAALV